jgi:hypothetical protein
MRYAQQEHFMAAPTNFGQAIVAALEPPSTRETDKKKKNKKCCVL